MKEFTTIIRAFDAAGVPYALCGGLAVAVHGAPRFTGSIDVIVSPEDIEPAKGVARACGFTAESLPMHFKATDTRIQRVIKLQDGDLLMLDLLLANDALRPVFETRVRLPFAGTELWVVSRPALLAMKLSAGRPQDLVDAAKLAEAS